METILVILICIVLLSGIGDLLFDALGFSVRIFLSIVLVIASIWLGIKLFIVMIPWMFVIALIAFIVGVIWMIKAIKNKV